MKRTVTLILSLTAFILGTALTSIDRSHPVYLNGNLLGNAVVIQGGIIAISLEDFAKASGAPLTLEPLFQLQGNRLFSKMSSAEFLKYEATHKYRGAATATTPEYKEQALGKIKFATGQLLQVQRGGEISSHLVMVNGKMFIPLADVARALGGGAAIPEARRLKPGDAIRLNFTKNQNSIIAILIGL